MSVLCPPKTDLGDSRANTHGANDQGTDRGPLRPARRDGVAAPQLRATSPRRRLPTVDRLRASVLDR
jgi:hypothetical protein